MLVAQDFSPFLTLHVSFHPWAFSQLLSHALLGWLLISSAPVMQGLTSIIPYVLIIFSWKYVSLCFLYQIVHSLGPGDVYSSFVCPVLEFQTLKHLTKELLSHRGWDGAAVRLALNHCRAVACKSVEWNQVRSMLLWFPFSFLCPQWESGSSMRRSSFRDVHLVLFAWISPRLLLPPYH